MRRILVANRAEIARRIIRTAKAMGLRTVAVYTDADADGLHVHDADEAVRIPSYLDVEAIIAAARATGANAVHPGYGFLSERGAAARAVANAGLTWIGPPADVIDALGDKVRAKALMAAAGVPTLPGGPVEDALDGPFPLLIKAAAGGGGRGMRVVATKADLADAIAGARHEAEAAFGEGTLFVERWLPDPRHVEVQIMADAHGRVIHLGERECSIQRRHQKVVEESPSPGIGESLRARMIQAAIAGAKAVGYVNAGTWEFLIDGDEFFFLEVNTRLQVEHPVTEAVTGLDLVRLQLEIAAGQAIPHQQDITRSGHAIEVRLVAEDPATDWLPSTGTLHRLQPTPQPQPHQVRYDLGYAAGSTVPPDYDSLIGKVIAHAPTRDEAADQLAGALDGLEIFGIQTNRALLADLLREPDFRAGRTTTSYLQSHPGSEGNADDAHRAEIAAAIWQQHHRRADATLPSGWRNVRSQGQRVTYGDDTVEYTIAGPAFIAVVEGHTATGIIHAVTTDAVDLEVTNRRCRYKVQQAGDAIWVGWPGGQVTLTEIARFADADAATAAGRGPTAPVPGTIIAIHVTPGEHITAGQTLLVLEAMKLEHRIRAEADGVVESIPVSVGDKVDAHQLLVHMAAIA